LPLEQSNRCTDNVEGANFGGAFAAMKLKERLCRGCIESLLARFIAFTRKRKLQKKVSHI
jgi:cytochrome b